MSALRGAVRVRTTVASRRIYLSWCVLCGAGELPSLTFMRNGNGHDTYAPRAFETESSVRDLFWKRENLGYDAWLHVSADGKRNGNMEQANRFLASMVGQAVLFLSKVEN